MPGMITNAEISIGAGPSVRSQPSKIKVPVGCNDVPFPATEDMNSFSMRNVDRVRICFSDFFLSYCIDRYPSRMNLSPEGESGLNVRIRDAAPCHPFSRMGRQLRAVDFQTRAHLFTSGIEGTVNFLDSQQQNMHICIYLQKQCNLLHSSRKL